MKAPDFRFAAMAVFGMLGLCGCSDSRATLTCPGAAILADVATRPVLKPGVAPELILGPQPAMASASELLLALTLGRPALLPCRVALEWLS